MKPSQFGTGTLFTENWESWIKDVKADLPYVDVTLVQYNTTVANADLDLADHTRMDPAPAEIAVSSFLVFRRRSKHEIGTVLGRHAG
jgi:hypothetical protein